MILQRDVCVLFHVVGMIVCVLMVHVSCSLQDSCMLPLHPYPILFLGILPLVVVDGR